MSRISQPELKKYMDRRVYVHIQANRAMSGVLRGYDMFLNLVLEQSFEELGAGERKPCGTSIIRGNSVSSLELVDSQKVYQERPAGGAPRM
ncbi:hypothetical protein QFC21_007051 [Naganishia friedmannii]|uniref:Uncharacterized protein n=1 Tax=Naganishia friedmannii TaxID=89922 RepID=A0ACC2UXS2_9TREE|nr:hypothetical protein QFC21_007051 [Naganishia friedmannii]